MVSRSMRISTCFVVLVVWGLSGGCAPAAAGEEAPFGLVWGASVEKLESLGIRLLPRHSDASGVRYAAKGLPKALSDLGETILSFGRNNKLHRIEAIGEDILNDPDGTRLKTRYEALSRALTSKYGPGVVRHEIVAPWTRPDDFVTGIYRGDSHYYTDFAADNVTVRLEIRATRRDVSNYALIFQYKEPSGRNQPLPDKDVL